MLPPACCYPAEKTDRAMKAAAAADREKRIERKEGLYL